MLKQPFACRWKQTTVRVSLGLVTILIVGRLALHFVPLPGRLNQPPAVSPVVTDRHGKTLRELLNDGHYARAAIPFEDIPARLRQATLAAEDKRFYTHGGVDPWAVLRAVAGQAGWRRAGERRSGGSTISEQLIKLAEPRPRTLFSKGLEAVQAWRLEEVCQKDDILAAYLNRLDYGNLNFGCAEAAHAYFNKPPRDLSTAEAAFLAALPQSPTQLNPYRHLERAKLRQQWVLQRMAADGYLTVDELSRARAEPLRLCPKRRPFEAPHFVDWLLARGGGRLEATAGTNGEIRTTLDLGLNRFITERLRQHLSGLRPEHVSNGAVVVIDNRRAEVIATVGSADYFAPRGGQINGAWARRSPGSAMKPFTYLLAFERDANPAAVVADLPTEFPTRSAIYRPQNYSHRFYGPMRMRVALANSLNISAVKVLADHAGGPAALLSTLRACGLTTLPLNADHYGLGLTLGNAEARLVELTNAYACLARLGEYRPCVALADTGSAAGGRQVCDPRAAYLIADILSDNAARALSFGVNSNLHWDFPVACKTGTSTDFRDNWAIGYTPEFTVGVWVGNFDGTPMVDVSGVTGAGPLLHEVFERLHAQNGTSWYERPAGVVERPVQRVTGHLLAGARGGEADAVLERFLAERLPVAEQPTDYDERGRVLLPSEYTAWLDSGDNWLAGQAVAANGPAGAAADAEAAFTVVSPIPGTTYVLDPDLPPSSRLLDLRVKGCETPRWESPTLDCQARDGQATAVLREGRHTLRVLDPATNQWRETWIVVRAL